MSYIYLLVGFAMLVFGGDMLVKGAVGVAEKLKIPHLIIGLTVVALGTSAPELFVSVDAAWEGVGGIAVGNIIGSNIANILLVLGAPAIIATSGAAPAGLGRNLIFMMGITILFMVILLTGSIGRFSGLVLLLSVVGFLIWQYREAMKHWNESGDDSEDDYADDVGNVPTSLRSIAALLALGLIGLQIGAQLIVGSAVTIAQSWGVSDAVIGLTIVAIGTSLPELAAAFASAWSGKSSLAIGNVVGSNIFNIAGILGITALILPLPVDPHLLKFDMWVMLAASLALCAMYVFRTQLGRPAGLAMTGAYITYLIMTFVIQ